MRYSLGLDIGITSVGWAVLNLDEKRLEGLGVRAFNKAEAPKDGAPLAEPRRLARAVRRRLRRRAGRLKRAKALFIERGLVTLDGLDQAFKTARGKATPWQLRAEGLDRLLTGEEFARSLFHIVKRRGFKSNRKHEEPKDKEDGKLRSGIDANVRRLREGGYRTAGEMFERACEFEHRKRNTTGFYGNAVDRATLDSEIRVLFRRQRDLGNAHAAPEFEEELLAIFHWQKPYASGDDILKMVGDCTFEKGEIRAPRHSYHAERFSLLGKVNSLTYLRNGDRLMLTEEERHKVVALAYQRARVTYAQVRATLSLPAEARFTGLNYLRRPEKGQPLRECVEECEKKTTFFELKGYHALRRAFDGDGLWEQVRRDSRLMDDLACALTFYKTDEDIRSELIDRGAPATVIEVATKCDGFAKTAHLSLKAIRRIVPFLENGMVYSDACAAAGYDHSGPTDEERCVKLPAIPPDSIRNPVVLRALSQARKVVNAVINRYGSPHRLHIELARDLGRSFDDRKKIQKRQEENRAERERLDECFRETFKREPNGTDILKWRLYNEQHGQCAYSQQAIDADRLFEPNYTEIDHILPYSRSFDDSRANKVLVLWSENQKKLNRIPYEVFGHDIGRWSAFEDWVKVTIRDPRKRANLLKEALDEKQESEWKERNLQDTRWIAREFSAFVRANLQFADSAGKQTVFCVSGGITARARWLWGLEKVREEDDLHHALDAAVIAAILPHQVKLLTEHAKVAETRREYVDPETGEVIGWERNKRPRLPQPWTGFRNEVKEKLPGVLVSRMPQRGMSGPLHKDTIRSERRADKDGKPVSVVRTPLTALSASDLGKLFAPETNQRLYAAIRARMSQFGNNAQKAFAEPLRKPTNDGSPGPIVKSVKVRQVQNSGVSVRGGIADNGDIIRTDVFRKPNKRGRWEYYLVPIYTWEKAAGVLPSKAITVGRLQEDWLVMDETYEFVFSLHKHDMIKVVKSSGEITGYYVTCDRNTASITMCDINDARQIIRGIGVKTLHSFEKFEMGVLGEYYPVRKEKRLGLEDGSHLKPGEAES